MECVQRMRFEGFRGDQTSIGPGGKILRWSFLNNFELPVVRSPKLKICRY